MLDNEPTLETLHEWDRLHQVHPWAAMDSWRGYDNIFVDRAQGIYLWDGQGKRFIDGPAGMWCTQIGYGRKEMADAIADQVLKLPYTSPWTNTTEPSSILAKKIAERTPGDLNNVFFTTGGSTAVDSAIRTMHFMNNRLGRPEKKIVISREKSYHGSTYLSHTVSGKERDKSRFDTETRLVRFLPDVNPYRRFGAKQKNKKKQEEHQSQFEIFKMALHETSSQAIERDTISFLREYARKIAK